MSEEYIYLRSSDAYMSNSYISKWKMAPAWDSALFQLHNSKDVRAYALGTVKNR